MIGSGTGETGATTGMIGIILNVDSAQLNKAAIAARTWIMSFIIGRLLVVKGFEK
jgi:hypothetical protein